MQGIRAIVAAAPALISVPFAFTVARNHRSTAQEVYAIFSFQDATFNARIVRIIR